MPNARIEFKQKAFLKGSRTFTVYDDESIRCVYRVGLSSFEFSLPLADLESEPQVHRHIEMPMLVGTVLLGLPALGLLLAGVRSTPDTGEDLVCYVFAGILGFFALLCFLTLRRKSQRSVIFTNTRNFNQNVVLLWALPSMEKLDEFIQFLHTRIAHARIHNPRPEGINIPAQIRDLVRLREEGHLTNEEFEKAKAQILDRERNP